MSEKVIVNLRIRSLREGVEGNPGAVLKRSFLVGVSHISGYTTKISNFTHTDNH
jgi:hypothetical protein